MMDPRVECTRYRVSPTSLIVIFVLYQLYSPPLAFFSGKLYPSATRNDRSIVLTDSSDGSFRLNFVTFNNTKHQHHRIRHTSCYSAANSSFCFPSLIIPGFEKSGSSALYFKLLRHPSILGHPKVKEWCPSEYDSSQAVVEWTRSEFMPRIPLNSSYKFLLNGCLAYVKHEQFFRTVARYSKQLKALVMVRNFADWSYSYYSYRCIEGYDEGCGSLRSVASLGEWKKNRNPSDFHKLVVNASNGNQPRHAYFSRIRPNIWLYREFLTSIIAIVGIENLLVIRQEDLTVNPRKTLSRVARFIGVDEDGFDEDAYTLVSNTNSKPAAKQKLPQNASTELASAVVNSGNMMMMKTRALLNKFWSAECRWLRATHSIDYPDTC